MKKSLITTIAVLSIAMLFSFKTIYDLKKSTAEVSTTENGYLIFFKSTPVMKYKILDTILPPNVDYDNFQKKIDKTLGQKYPKCDGVIVINKRSLIIFHPIQFE